MILMYDVDENEINWEDIEDLKKRLFRITQLSSKIVGKTYEFGDIFMAKHNITSSNAKYESVTFSINREHKFIQNSHVQIKAVKVKISILGKIIKIVE